VVATPAHDGVQDGSWKERRKGLPLPRLSMVATLVE
jgi:hypothetical protein